MTTPNIVQDGPDLDGMDAFESTIASSLHDSKDLIAADQPITDRPRDGQGRFVAQAEGVDAQGQPSAKPAPGEWHVVPDATAPLPEGDGTVPPVTEPAKPAIPDGYVAPAALAPEKVQGFKVFDSEGEVIPPDLKFEVNFRGPNGELKPRTFDLPKLINFARQGEYNHERDQRAIAVQQENFGLTQRVSQSDQSVRALQQERERLLSDPDYLIAQLDQFEKANTPEARQQREKDQIEHDRQALAFDRASQENASFLETGVAPALDTIVATLSTVTLDEVANRLAQVIEPYKVKTQFGTVIHPNHFGRVQQAVLDLVPWAQQLHADREDRQAPAPKDAPKPAPVPDKDAIRNAKTRRLATAAIKPAGGNGQIPSPPTPQKPITSNRDMEDMIVGRSLAGATGRTG